MIILAQAYAVPTDAVIAVLDGDTIASRAASNDATRLTGQVKMQSRT